MIELNLDADEGIILEEDSVVWYGAERISLRQLSLTNKSLYLVYIVKRKDQKPKRIQEIIQISLSDIKIINGVPLVEQVRNSDYGVAVQIQSARGREQFAFTEGARRKTPVWVHQIKKLLGVEESEQPRGPKKSSLFGVLSESLGSGFGGVAAGFKEIAETAKETVSATAKQMTGSAAEAYEIKKEQIQHNKQEIEQAQFEYEQAFAPQSLPMKKTTGRKFCSNCGSPLALGVKFCSECGASTGKSSSAPVVPPPVPVVTETQTARQQTFAGTVVKCANCGAPISETTVICPECGYQITGRGAVSSVQTFNNQLMTIEATRKTSALAGGGLLGAIAGPDPADKKKLTLIRNYPIPNTIDDITEFVMLAIANIDVGLSKKTFSNSVAPRENYASDMPRVISNAWVSKLQQAYQKAKLMFPNDQAFGNLRAVYLEKMKELKIKIKE